MALLFSHFLILAAFTAAPAFADNCLLGWVRLLGLHYVHFERYVTKDQTLAAPQTPETSSERLRRATKILQNASPPVLGPDRKLTANQITAIETIAKMEITPKDPAAALWKMVAILRDAFPQNKHVPYRLIANGIGPSLRWSSTNDVELLLSVRAPGWAVADAIQDGLLGEGHGHEVAAQMLRDHALRNLGGFQGVHPRQDAALAFWQNTALGRRWKALGGKIEPTMNGPYPEVSFSAAQLLAVARREGRLPPIPNLRLEGVTAAELQELRPFLFGVQNLVLNQVTAEVLNSIPTTISSLQIRFEEGAHPTATDWQALFHRLPNLQGLDLSNNHLHFRQLALGELPSQLTVLKLGSLQPESRAEEASERTRFLADLKRSLPNLTQLQALDLSGVDTRTATAILELVPSSLQDLSLRQIPPATLHALWPRVPKLRNLNLAYSALEGLAGAPTTLHWLDCYGAYSDELSASQQGEIFARFTQLQGLSLANAKVADSALYHLPEGLKTLDLRWSETGGNHLRQALARLTELEELNLARSAATATVLPAIPKSVTTLDLSRLDGYNGAGVLTASDLERWLPSRPALRLVRAYGIVGDGQPWPFADTESSHTVVAHDRGPAPPTNP